MWEQIFQLDQFIRDQLGSQEIERIGGFILQLNTPRFISIDTERSVLLDTAEIWIRSVDREWADRNEANAEDRRRFACTPSDTRTTPERDPTFDSDRYRNNQSRPSDDRTTARLLISSSRISDSILWWSWRILHFLREANWISVVCNWRRDR